MSEGRFRTRLTGVARDLADVIGEDGLARLVAHRGGARLTVHSTPRLESALAAELGPAYLPLQTAFAGESFDVPLLCSSPSRCSEEAILADLSTGHSADQIAPRYRITRRRVFRILARAKARRSTPSVHPSPA